VVTLSDTRLEPDLEDLLWSTVNVFHRAIDRIERELDDNELAQQRSQREQDGSEVKSVELERLTAEGQTLIERRNAFELIRYQAADQFDHHTHSAWRPRNGSKVNHRNLTSAMIDSRNFLAAKEGADKQVLLPAGPKVALTGGLDFNDQRLIWTKLDQVHAKHPEMVLLHGGSPKGAELIATKWADNRKVPHIAFKPNWTKHAKPAPFKCNDAMVGTLPIGVLHFPGTGIQDRLPAQRSNIVGSNGTGVVNAAIKSLTARSDYLQEIPPGIGEEGDAQAHRQNVVRLADDLHATLLEFLDGGVDVVDADAEMMPS
jgi:hypothetical protein